MPESSPKLPPLDDVIGKKVFVDGFEWTVRYSEVAKRLVLERPVEGGVELLLQAMREGAVRLDTDPGELVAQPLPTTQEAATQEWRYLDAMIAGARQHGTLEPAAIGLLERRLAQLTSFLAQPK